MKPKILLLYIDQAAKQGIISYISSIFHPYLDIEGQQIDHIDYDSLNNYQLILFSSPLCHDLRAEAVSRFQIPSITCRRELNHTYIHRMLEIPPSSVVCIVNDRKKNCEAVQKNLLALGFSSFRYEIYYPGGPAPDPSIQYAVTPGEARFVPASIKTVIDVGNRILDIATLGKVVLHFNLPEDILNQVTEQYSNYVGNFIRYINHQMRQLISQPLNTGRLFHSLDFGVCLTDFSGKILYGNPALRTFLKIPTEFMEGMDLQAVLHSLDRSMDLDRLLSRKQISFQDPDGQIIDFRFSNQLVTTQSEIQYLFIATVRYTGGGELDDIIPCTEESAGFRSYENADLFRFFSSLGSLSSVMKQAPLYAGTEYPVLLVGEPGLYQLSFARLIHQLSPRRDQRFLCLDAAVLDLKNLHNLTDGSEAGTIFIDHIHQASPQIQAQLCLFLKDRESLSLMPKTRTNPANDIRMICSVPDLEALTDETRFLPELFYRLNSLILRLPPLREMRKELPEFYGYFMNRLAKNMNISVKSLFTHRLWKFLIQAYEYPGNFRELESICQYFSCIYNGSQLTISQLPPYISFRPVTEAALSVRELSVLQVIKNHPHCGRNRIASLLEEQNISMASSQVRSILTRLHEKNYIQILKTRQGCVLTELGQYLLDRA